MTSQDPKIVDYQWCVNSNELPANTDTVLVNQSTLEPAVFPAGSIIELIWLRAGSALESGAEFKLGVVGADNHFFDTDLGVTSDMLNSGDVKYEASGLGQSLGSDGVITLNPGNVEVTGQVIVYLEYNKFDDLP